jgi:hypothetical protein
MAIEMGRPEAPNSNGDVNQLIARISSPTGGVGGLILWRKLDESILPMVARFGLCNPHHNARRRIGQEVSTNVVWDKTEIRYSADVLLPRLLLVQLS